MIKPGASLIRCGAVFHIRNPPGGRPPHRHQPVEQASGCGYVNHDARPGDRIACLGPLGQPFVPVRPPDEAWMIAGGVGLAPFATLGEALAAVRTPTTLLYGGRTSADLFREEFFEALGTRLLLTTEDGSRGERGRVTAPLARLLGERRPENPVTLYACGPTPMMRAVAELGRQFTRATFVSLSRSWDALGGCTVVSCAAPVGFHRSCLRPVSDADDRVDPGRNTDACANFGSLTLTDVTLDDLWTCPSTRHDKESNHAANHITSIDLALGASP
jgi:dihydroorotate dehydrogenase electron transfer subunit